MDNDADVSNFNCERNGHFLNFETKLSGVPIKPPGLKVIHARVMQGDCYWFISGTPNEFPTKIKRWAPHNLNDPPIEQMTLEEFTRAFVIWYRWADCNGAA